MINESPLAEAYKKYFEDLERRSGWLPEKSMVSIEGLDKLTQPHAVSRLIDSGIQPIIHARVTFRKIQLSIGLRVDDLSGASLD